MIAFIQPPVKTTRPPALRQVHRLLATTLLPTRFDPLSDAPPVAGWKAWLFAGWLAAVALWGGIQTVMDLF